MDNDETRQTYSIWESDHGSIITMIGSSGPVVDESGRLLEPDPSGVLEPDAVKVAEFEADSIDEATEIRNRRYGWGLHSSPA